MAIYLVAFLISSLMFYLSSKSKRRLNINFLASIGIIILAVLAGLRDASIGTDVNVYGRVFYQEAVNSSTFMSYFSAHVDSLFSEPGFHLLTYFLSRIFYDYHWGLFAYQLFPLVFIYLGMRRCRKLFNTPIWLGMLLYDFMLYNNSLNIMRQCMAVGFVFYGATYLFEKRYRIFFVYIAVAAMFHTSSIISLSLLPMYLILQQGKKVSQRKQIQQGGVFVGLLFVLLISGTQIVTFLVQRGIIRDYYLQYLSGGMFSGSTTGIPYMIVLGNLLYTAIMAFYKRYTDYRRGESLFFIMSSVVVVIASIAVGYVQYIDRLSFFFIPFQALGLSNIYNSNRSKETYVILVVGLAFALWLYSIVLKGSGETVPYKFFFT